VPDLCGKNVKPSDSVTMEKFLKRFKKFREE
jgi:hypothetical protein